MERLLLKPTEAADALGVGRSKVYALIDAGVLPSVRLGGSVRVPVAELEKWVRDQASARRAAGEEESGDGNTVGRQARTR